MQRQSQPPSMFFISVCIAALMLVCSSATAQPPQEAHIFLDRLGLTVAIEATDRVIAQSLQPLDSFLTEQQQQKVSQQLRASNGAEITRAGVVAYAVANMPAVAAQALTLLEDPLINRVRNFDIAMEMDGAYAKYQAYSIKLQSNPPRAQRLDLILRLDRALQVSAIAALMQTEINTTARGLAAQLAARPDLQITVELTRHQQQQRQQHMEQVLTQLHLFSYRYLKDKELQRYVELLESDSIQTVLAVLIRGLENTLREARDERLTAGMGSGS